MTIHTIADILALSNGDPVKLRAIRGALERLADELSEIAGHQVTFLIDHMAGEEESKDLYQQRRPPEWLREWSSEREQDDEEEKTRRKEKDRRKET